MTRSGRWLGALAWFFFLVMACPATETGKPYPPTTAEERARHRRIWEAVDEGRFDDARKLANEAVAARPDDVEAHFALAHARMHHESRVDGVLRDLRSRMKLEPKNPLWPVLLVRLGAESRFWEDESELYRLAGRAVVLAPDWGWSHFASGDAHQFYGQQRDATTEAFRRAVESDPGNPVFVLAYGGRLERHGRYDQSEKLYSSLVSIDPEEAVARRQMWRARCMQRPVAQFRAELDAEIAAALAKFPKSAPLYREAAYFYGVFLRDTVRAEPLKAEAARLSPNAGHRYGYRLFSRVTRIGTVQTVCLTGPAVEEEKRFAAVRAGTPEEQFNKLLEFLRPLKVGNTTVRYFERFFDICVETRKPVDAEATADRLTAFDRSYLPLYGEVARLYLDAGNNAERALRLAQRAAAARFPVVKRSFSADYIPLWEIQDAQDRLFAINTETLALALIANGREAEAIAPLSASVSRRPSCAAFFKLGQLLERRGQARGAFEAYADAAACQYPGAREAMTALATASGITRPVQVELNAAGDRQLARRQRDLRNRLENRPAPELSVIALDGNRRLGSADLFGKVAVLSFWETDHPRSRVQFPHLVTLYNRFSRFPDFSFVSLNQEGNHPTTLQFLKTAVPPFPVHEGRQAGMDFAISNFPTCLVLDRRGRIRYVKEDFDSVAGMDDLDAVIRLLLAESKGQAGQSRPARRGTAARNR